MRLNVVVGFNSEAGGLILPNSGKPVLMKSYDPAAKLGQISIDRIIEIRMEIFFLALFWVPFINHS